ncbi:GNAT family N-acetyltransferase [Longimycelium tulufanense]|uniref:GNAT family N-acetyltransferase n=1 Tax=Longimycelium tulufanense TaxID=907463 RepID=UPI001E295C71|nr:GNAT family N-acetyltransferase [Longimycelium tulufanense]
MAELRAVATEDLTPKETAALRGLLDDVFEDDFSQEDWDHTLGGWHFVISEKEQPIAHASVVERVLTSRRRRYRTGYVEGVGVREDARGCGHGRAVMTAASEYIRDNFELGALGATEEGARLYQSLGWQRVLGPTLAEIDGKPQRTPDEDGYIFVLLTPCTGPFDLQAPLMCDWRTGDVW